VTDKGERENVRAERDAMAAALTAIDGGIAVFDATGRFVVCNAGYHDLFPGSEAVLQSGAEYWMVMVDHAESVIDPTESSRLSQIGTQFVSDDAPLSVPQYFATRDGRRLELRRWTDDEGRLVCLWKDATSRLETETEVVRLQARLRDAVRSLSDGFLLYDPDDRLVLVNPGFAERYHLPSDFVPLGWSRERLTRELAAMNALVPPLGDEAERERKIAELIAPRDETGVSFEVRGGDGRWLRVSETRTLDGGVVSIHSDITEIKRREDELARRTALLDAVTQAASRVVGRGEWREGIQDMLSRLGRVLRVGRAGLHRVRRGEDGAILHSRLFEWIAADATRENDAEEPVERLDLGDGTMDPWVALLAAGEPIIAGTVDVTGPMRAVLERRGVVSRLAVPIVIAGEWWGYVAFDDLTTERTWSLRETEALRAAANLAAGAVRRARLDDELALSEARKRAIVETALDCVLTIDASGVLVEFNPAAERVLGWSREEALGRRMDEMIIPPEFRDAHRRGIERSLDNLTDTPLGRRIELTAKRRDGSTFPCELALTASQVGTERFFTAYLRDITARRDAERVSREARERAEEAARMKSDFLNNMSHELRTPLNSVIGFSELLREEVLGALGQPKYKEFAAAIHLSGTHLLKIINDVLDMTRIESGNASPVREPLDLPEIVGRAVEEFAEEAESKGISIVIDLDPAVEPVADRRAMTRVLRNLLSNAVKFTPVGGSVRVWSRSGADGWSELGVTDTGVGMDPTTAVRVFEPFRQGQSGLNREHEGVGLGLAMVRALAEQHGGRVELDSEPGKGTTVIVALPPAECDSPEIL